MGHKTNQMKVSDQEVSEYLIKNPKDFAVLVYSAYQEELKNWENKFWNLHEKISKIQIQISSLKMQLDNIGVWKSFWKKIAGKSKEQKIIERKIEDLNSEHKRLIKYGLHLVSNPPEEIRYQLGAMGNTLFSFKE